LTSNYYSKDSYAFASDKLLKAFCRVAYASGCPCVYVIKFVSRMSYKLLAGI